jgi:leader peptidase (prepilin peptidase)/N-methyltransferase
MGRRWWQRLGTRTAYILAAAGLGVLGLAVGRILKGVIARLPRCPRLSIRFPAIELLTGALYVACLWRFGWQYALVPALVLVSLLVPIALIDAEHWILPFELTLPGIAAGVVLSLPLGARQVEGALWGVAVGFLGFRALEYLGWRIFRRETLGGGDKYLLALLGAFLTSRPLPFVVALASLQAVLFSLTQRLRSRHTGDDVPASSQEAGLEQDTPLEPPEAVETPPPRITWRFLAPGLSPWRRVILLPYSLLIQPIPDRPPPVEELKSTPEVVSLPFGPWMVLAGLEVMFLHA